MTDHLNRSARYENMRRIMASGTRPELLVQERVRKLGLLWRENDPSLPGRPDIALYEVKVAIFVHGCFWHFHQDPCCTRARLPNTNRAYWLEKLARNMKRDERDQAKLERLGWSPIVLWECELNHFDLIDRRIRAILNEIQ